MKTITLTLSCIAALSACAGSGASPGREPFSDVEETRITVVVQNLNFSDARLYAFRRGSRESLGVVGGKADAEFTLDWPITAPLYIEIDLLAGPSCRTEELRADPGDIFELQIQSVFSQTANCR